MQQLLVKGTDQALASKYFEARGTETRKRVYNHVFRKLGNRSDAEDVTQETLVRAWSSLASYDPSRSFDAWILRIATNVCIDQIRRCRCRPMVSLDTPPNTDPDGEGGGIEIADLSQDPETLLLATVLDEGLQQGIGALPSLYRTCVVLKGQGYSYEEIATTMHCPIGTVRSRIHRARTHLSRAMRR